MSVTFTPDDLKIRQLLFAPCKTRQELHDWIEFFLDLDLPGVQVDEDSNSSPLDMVWDCYTHQIHGCEDKNVSRILYYSSREGGKSLSESVIEVMLLFHARNNIFHLAAIKQQSIDVQRYIKKFLSKAKLRPFLEGDNKTLTGVVFYYPKDPSFPCLSEREWKTLDREEQDLYDLVTNSTEVIVASVQACNGKHGMLVLDEIDVMLGEEERAAYWQSVNIPSSSFSINGEERLPLTVLTSTRKTSFGLVQNEINDAKRTGLIIKHWNVLDVTRACEPERHLPTLPKVTIYRSTDLLSALSERDYSTLPPKDQEKYVKDEGYAGCLKNCKLFGICRGRLATKQTSTSKFLKNIDHVQNQFRINPLEQAKSELMCFGSGTKILMKDGTVKNIEKVKIGDEVISHNGRACKVSKSLCRDYTGSVLSFMSPSWDFEKKKTVVTPEHPFFVNGEDFVSIKDVNQSVSIGKQYRKLGDYFSLPIGRSEPSNRRVFDYSTFVDSKTMTWDNNVSLDRCGPKGRPIRKIFDVGKWGWIIGFYLAEGFQSKKGHNKNTRKWRSGITFCTHVKEEEYHRKVRDFAKSIGLEVAERKVTKTNGYTQTINNGTLAELFYSFCNEHSHNKRIHPLLMNLDNKFLGDLLDGFMCGDGTKNLETRHELTTCSQYLATQLYLIAARLGLCPKIRTSKIAKGSTKTPYRLSYFNTSYKYQIKNTKFKIENNYNQYRIDELEETLYCGKVYNLEVEGDNSYIADGLAVHNCWKPGTTGLVYPRFDEQKHVITPAEAYYRIVGESPTQGPNMNKKELVAFAKTRELPFAGGMDFGYTHLFAYVHGFKDLSKFFVTSAFGIPELEPDQQLAVMMQFKHDNPAIFADPENAQLIRVFKTNQFRMVKWIKSKGSVVGGISCVQMKLTPTLGAEPELLFVREVGEDPGMDLLIKYVREHHWKLDAANKPTDLISDDNKDLPDALRYLIMNVFPYKGKTVSDNTLPADTRPHVDEAGVQYHVNTWMSQKLAELTGEEFSGKPKQRKIEISSLDGKHLVFDYYSESNQPVPQDKAEKRGRGGGIIYDFS
jgi:intein/homing endonuclease